jgi:hypothetical protein
MSSRTLVEALEADSIHELQSRLLTLVQLAASSHLITDIKVSHEAHVDPASGTVHYTALAIFSTR